MNLIILILTNTIPYKKNKKIKNKAIYNNSLNSNHISCQQSNKILSNLQVKIFKRIVFFSLSIFNLHSHFELCSRSFIF